MVQYVLLRYVFTFISTLAHHARGGTSYGAGGGWTPPTPDFDAMGRD